MVSTTRYESSVKSRMKRRLEYGCMLILTVLWLSFIALYLCAQERTEGKAEQFRDITKLVNESYTVDYSPALRIPISADWVLCSDDMGKACREPSWRFIEDMRVPKPQATHNDYLHSGYDRGHMVPAADRSKSISSMKSTFLMTNVAPQVPSLNRGEWAKVERACRAYARNGNPLSIHVDAVFWLADTQLIGGNKIAVPHGFVKTVRTLLGDSIIYCKYFQNY